MRVMITGGAGLIGKAAAAHLIERGNEVHLIDLAPPNHVPYTTYAVCDITDYAAVSDQMRGCDAVVHLAALRSPYLAPGQDVFRVNVVSTFNVFEAAAKAGIRRVVQASSINAIGCAWNLDDFKPRYFPLDEDHPIHTTDPYSFSKQQIEAIGAYFWRRDGISGAALRFPWVYAAAHSHKFFERRAEGFQWLSSLLALPDDQRERKLANVRASSLAYRAARFLEYPHNAATPPPDTDDELLWSAYTFDRFNLWASLDVRDAAYAIELSLTTPYEGAHPLFITDDHNWLDYESRTLVRLFFPDVTEFKTPLEGSESLFSSARARDLIGFAPRHSLHGVKP